MTSDAPVELTRHARLRYRTAMLSLVVGFLMLALKSGAYLVTGSVAILSDAIESVVHVGATVAMFFSMRLSLQPPDVEHPYGHGRIEHFSVGFEGGMVVLAGIGIVWATVDKLFAGYEPSEVDIGLWAMLIAAGINLILGSYLVYVGRSAKSGILVADGKHVLSDVWTSFGVAVGLVLVIYTGAVWIDAVCALAVSALLLWEGGKLVRTAFAGLLDEVDVDTLETVVTVLNEERESDWMDIHSLRCRRAGDDYHIDFHLVIPGERTVREMHTQLDRLEAAVLTRLGGRGSVLAHFDHPPVGLAEETLERTYPNFRSPFTLAAATRLANTDEPTDLNAS